MREGQTAGEGPGPPGGDAEEGPGAERDHIQTSPRSRSAGAGFATFRQRDAAEIFVKYSPHKLHNAEIFADFKKVKKTKRADTSNKVSHVLINLLDNGGRSEQYSWQSYFAPRRVKSVLMGIGEELHPEHLERARRSRRAMFGDENISAPGVPLVLFHGPPDTGKTHAMRVIAAESGLKPLLLDTRKLQEDSYRAPHLWASVLDAIAESETSLRGVRTTVATIQGTCICCI